MTARYCPACRQIVQEGDKFCTSCGTTLPSSPPSPQVAPQASNSTEKPQRKWLKWTGIGCGGLLAVIILVIILAVALGGESSEDGPSVSSERNATSPNATPVRPIDPRVIWDDYLSNETRANRTWKEDWLTLRMGPIDEIEDGGRVLMYMDQIGWNHIEMDFKDDDDVLHLARGDFVTAVCKLSGFELDSWLNFKDCRYPE